MEKRTFLLIGLGLGIAEIAYLAISFAIALFLPDFIALLNLSGIPGAENALNSIISAAIMYGTLILVIWLFIRRLPSMPKKPHAKISFGMIAILIIICFGFGYLLAIGGSFINELFKSGVKFVFSPFFYFQPSDIEQDKSTLEFIASVIVIVGFAPVFEEFIFRKLLLNKLRPFGDTVAILFTGIAFGLTHLNFGQFFFATFIGFVAGYVAIKTNNLIYPIIMHAVYNGVSAIIIPFTTWLDNTVMAAGIPLASLIFTGFVFSSMVVGPAIFFTNLKRINLSRPEYRFSVPLSGKMIFANAGTIIYLVIISLIFVFVALVS